MIQALIAKLGTYLLLAVVALTLGAGAGYAYEKRSFDNFKLKEALVEQSAADAAAATAAHDKQVKETIDAANEKALVGYAGYIAQLLRQRAGGGKVPAPSAGAAVAPAATVGPGPGPADTAVPCPDTSASDHVTLDALIQLKAWRAYARGTGQGS